MRVIASTNHVLEDDVAEGRFSQDLFYRLNVIPISLSPLRERRDDIGPLARHFLKLYAARHEKKGVMDIAPQAFEAMMRYDWSGNATELDNVIERAVVLTNDGRVHLAHLPKAVQQSKVEDNAPSVKGITVPSNVGTNDQRIISLELVEKYAIENALKLCHSNVSEAARRLKVGQATLYRKLDKYRIR